MTIFSGYHGFLKVIICIAIISITPSLTYGMSTTYDLNGGEGSFTLDNPVDMAPSEFEAWNLSFAGFVWNNNSDTTLIVNFCTSSRCEVSTINPEGEEILFLVDVIGATFRASGFSDDIGAFDESGTYSNDPSTVPEPTTMLLFGSGLLCLAGYRWHQRRRESVCR